MSRIIFMLLLTPLLSYGQVWSHIKKNIPAYSFLFVAGAFDGMAESIEHHYPAFKRTFHVKNDQFWDPSLSWTNKYKNGDPEQGPRFFLSTTALVGYTDGYHVMRTWRNMFVVGAFTIKLGQKQKWYYYALDFGMCTIVYLGGFNASFELIH